MVAFHFPPHSGGSGIQRTLRFVQQLPAYGWQPIVVSAKPQAYPDVAADLMNEIPPGTVVKRSFALDTARHLAIKGRYFGWMARPDRWMSWKWAAVRDGMRLIEQFKPEVIWSTYPLATAHHIGAELKQRSGLPWVADFRDPMAQEGYPADPVVWQSFKAIEMRALQEASCCVFTTPGAAQSYKVNYPQAADRVKVIENGFDEESFASPLNALPDKNALNAGRLTLLHSGIVYPSERDPRQLFVALANLRQRGDELFGRLCLRFRAPVHDDLVRILTAQYGLQDIIQVCPPIPHKDALIEMMRADALLIMQASNCNAQIPAKFYEYLRAYKPILGLTDPVGDTAFALRQAGITALARLDSVNEIQYLLPKFLAEVARGEANLPSRQSIRESSRESRTQALAGVLTAVTQS
jgi:glycosyltransferase involved in cell wall biosynthesis